MKYGIRFLNKGIKELLMDPEIPDQVYRSSFHQACRFASRHFASKPGTGWEIVPVRGESEAAVGSY